MELKKSTTSKIVQVFFLDTTSVIGAGKTGLAYNTSGLTCYYKRNQGMASVAVTLATMTLGTFTDSGFKEVDATHMPGLYEFGVPDAALATGSDGSTEVTVMFALSGHEAVTRPLRFDLIALDKQDATRGGLTALPNANAEAAGGLFTRGTGAGQINQDANGRIDVSLKAILGTVLTETSGQIAAAFKKFFDKATPTGTVNSLPDAVPGASNGLPTTDASNGVTLKDSAITAAKIASDAITAGKIAADAIGASELAADAVAEIAAGVAAAAGGTTVTTAVDDAITPTETRFKTTLTSTTDDQYARWIVVVRPSEADQNMSAVKSYNGSTKVLELYFPLPSGAPADGDVVWLIPSRG